jgi:mRNA-degrading endonuclease YafQ of YafQ-DinJ toxin-antitoxin module
MDAIELFLDDPTHESLRNHPLVDEWAGWYSISANDDLRMQYKLVDGETAFFVAVGTHGELYR